MKSTSLPVLQTNIPGFLSGSGEMEKLIRSIDWAKTSL